MNRPCGNRCALYFLYVRASWRWLRPSAPQNAGSPRRHFWDFRVRSIPQDLTRQLLSSPQGAFLIIILLTEHYQDVLKEHLEPAQARAFSLPPSEADQTPKKGRTNPISRLLYKITITVFTRNCKAVIFIFCHIFTVNSPTFSNS